MKKGNHVHSMEHLHRGNSKFCFQVKRVEGKEERYIVGISIDRKHEEFMKASSYFSSCLVEGIIITPSNTLSSLYRFNEFPPPPLPPCNVSREERSKVFAWKSLKLNVSRGRGANRGCVLLEIFIVPRMDT